MAIKIFIYDDSLDRLESLKALIDLSEELTWVGEAENCVYALQDMKENMPDVVLMDINMPIVDGLKGLQIIKKNYPAIKVLIQTAFDDDDKIFTSIKNGASGYILKNDKPSKILQAVHEVYEGGAAMNPAIALKVMEYFKPQAHVNPLSVKENEVLTHLSSGLSYKMVADRMGISYGTVNTYSKRIYEKLHISSLGEAIAWYYNNK